MYPWICFHICITLSYPKLPKARDQQHNISIISQSQKWHLGFVRLQDITLLPAECKEEYGIKKGHPDSLISKAQATELQGDLRGPGCTLSMNGTLAQDYKSRDWFDIAHYSSMPE